MSDQPVDTKTALELIGRSYHRVIPDRLRSEVFWQREKAHLVTIMERSPDVAAADPDSLARAVANAGAIGLSLDPVLGLIYLIPRRERKKKDGESWADYNRTVGWQVTATPSYKGLAELAVASERVVQIAAEIVFESDTFRYHGPMHAPTHEAVHRPADRVYDKAVGVYACARLRERAGYNSTGVFQSAYLDREEVQRIRMMSDRPDSLMWHPDKVWTEGWKKAAVRRLFKLVPKSQRMVEAMRMMNEAEGHEPDPVVEKPAQAVVLISDEDVAALRQQLVGGGVPEAKLPEWIDRLAMRFQVARLDDLPRDELPKAKKLIGEALAAAKARKEAAK